ncbi:homoprotocatechuate degradation operon regulator HpaR [Pseudogulbenkiania ferrooxidans]|uniref:Transcriptional regulator, MarR family n=1 Tax=Pseudogulbenkiania ferrooxidans 2002 TaxID=279714 RepID=B9Z422_9NEIS|nr:homoprotocatechuate degradation operon regulator HpaR [Pseudogulbenkiania ferrooxidans]EEG08599.1 transcriptional regulator, MarR family [Pseudogulbenkiania ferrooxidans 2002]
MENHPPLHQHRLPQHLLRAREAVMAYFRPVLNSFGLTEQQWRILRLLDDRGELEAGVVADLACILSPSLTGILVRMEKAGLIHRRRDTVDSRRLIVSVSEEGRALTRRIAPLSEACYEQIESYFGRDKLDQLIQLLSELEKLPVPQGIPQFEAVTEETTD